MTARRAREPRQGEDAPRGRKGTQRERLMAGIIAIVARDGYASASVSRIITEAGVSRPTFYEYFGDKDDCYLCALGEIHERLITRVRRVIDERPPEVAMQAGLAAIVAFARAEPVAALFLTSHTMGASSRALDARDAGIAAVERIIDGARARLSPTAPTADVSAGILIGGTYRLLASRLRRGEPGMVKTIDELSAWVASYERPAGRRRWQSLESTRVPAAPQGLGPAIRLPLQGRGSSSGRVPGDQRQRILYAAARLAEQKGYNATTIADITRLAGVDGRTFYSAFADKQDAFMAVHELGARQVMSATAAAFFTGASWPERMWAAGRAFAQFLDENPMIAHVGFVEAYAVGPGAVQRVEDSHVTFTIFLQEGYQHERGRTPPSRLALEATITSIFEIVYRQARGRKQPRVGEMLGAMAFLALAPFMGAEEAMRFVDRQLQA
jgi:AcrR family transcriptional regulator